MQTVCAAVVGPARWIVPGYAGYASRRQDIACDEIAAVGWFKHMGPKNYNAYRNVVCRLPACAMGTPAGLPQRGAHHTSAPGMPRSRMIRP